MRYFLSALLFILYYEASGQCATAGPNNSSTFSNNSSVGDFSWSNTLNAQTSNNSMSTASRLLGILSSHNSNYLVASNPGFSIPSSASICGIEVEVERRANILVGIGAVIRENSVRIVKGGTITGTDQASTNNWPASKAYTTYGNSTDLWGETWTPADINAASFGVAISARVSSGLASVIPSAEIDHIRITVYYAIVLPLKFEEFSAAPVAGKMKLNWSTGSESNSSHFLVQKLVNNTAEWEIIDSVKSIQNSNNKNQYETLDISPGATNYYRIKHVDMKGTYNYSRTISINYYVPEKNNIKIYPNPVSERVKINSQYPLINLKLTDVTGKEILSRNSFANNNFYELYLGDLKAGMYFLSIKTVSGEIIERIFLR